MIAKVAVENTAFSFDDAFDYAIPEKLSKDVRPGVRVLVPFGRGSKKRQGVVFALREKSKDAVKLKNIAAVLDPSPLLNNEMLRLAVFMKDEYFCTLYEAVKAMLPTGLGLNLVTYSKSRCYRRYADFSVTGRKKRVFVSFGQERICPRRQTSQRAWI